MGRFDISSTRPTQGSHYGTFPGPGGHPTRPITTPSQTPVFGLGHINRTDVSLNISAAHLHSQARDAILHSAESAANHGFPQVAQVRDSIPDTFLSNSIPTSVAPLYNTTAQSYLGDASNFSEQCGVNLSSPSSLYNPANGGHYRTDDIPEPRDTTIPSLASESVISLYGRRETSSSYYGRDPSHALRYRIEEPYLFAGADHCTTNFLPIHSTHLPVTQPTPLSPIPETPSHSYYYPTSRGPDSGTHFLHGYPICTSSEQPPISLTPAPTSGIHHDTYNPTSLVNHTSESQLHGISDFPSSCARGLDDRAHFIHGHSTYNPQSPSGLSSISLMTPSVGSEFSRSPTPSSYISQLHLPEPPVPSYKSSNRVYVLPDRSTHDLTILPPSSRSPISASRSEISHSNPHYPTPLAGNNHQTIESNQFRGQQQPGAPQVSNIIIDVLRQELIGTSISIGECLRRDSPCGFWIKTDKKSIKCHAQRRHHDAPGGDTILVPCTWKDCGRMMRKGSIPRHTMEKHFGEIFSCNGCSRPFTREHICSNHAQGCQFGSGYTTSRANHVRVVNVASISRRAR